MPNYKYEAFRHQIYKEFLQGKTVQDVIVAYNLGSKPDLEQNLPTRNIIYTWYKDYLQQNGQNLQSRSDLQSVNLQNEGQDPDCKQIINQQNSACKETEPLQAVNIEKEDKGNNDLLVIGSMIVGAVILLLSML